MVDDPEQHVAHCGRYALRVELRVEQCEFLLHSGRHRASLCTQSPLTARRYCVCGNRAERERGFTSPLCTLHGTAAVLATPEQRG